MNHIRLRLKLKTTDWPAAVARDFLLAAANTVPLYIPGASVAPVESRTVDEDIRVLAQLANQIQLNDGKHFYSLVVFHCFMTFFLRYIQINSTCVSTITQDAPSTTP